VNWRNALLPLLAKLKEEEKVKSAKLEEKVNVTELERLKVKVPRFTKEIILVIYLHHIFEDMGRYNSCEASNRRWQASFSENINKVYGAFGNAFYSSFKKFSFFVHI
jgi:hypothetical protein